MGNEIFLIGIFTVLALAVGFAWVGGYLDKYQSKAQEKALDAMGENKTSYGLKSMFAPTPAIGRGKLADQLLFLRHSQRPADR